MTPHALLAPARLAGRSVLRSQSDERLVDLVRAGSEPAFEAIVARYRGALLRYCRNILPDARAEDAVQQTLVSAFNAMKQNDADINLRPWLYRIAHNTALNALRDRGLRHAELEESFDGVERPDQATERRQHLREVLGAVQSLPERQRDAVVLRELEGRSYEEIAGELGVTGGAVRQLLNRARNTLRAGMTAVTPMPLLLRIPWSEAGEPATARVAELVAVGGTGAAAGKLAATALVTGAVAGGAVVATEEGRDPGARDRPPAAAEAAGPPGGDAAQGSARPAGAREDDGPGGGRGGEGGEDRSGRRRREKDEDDDRSGPGHGGGHEDRSGPGGGGGDHDNSGPGSGTAAAREDNSGPGGGGGGDSSGSGSGSSGSGSSGSGSGSSGSGSSGSGSGSSGSGSSGSGSSGSGSDDSGSGSSGSG
jgi:RNA polymerase sigma factor (sigma-70 family)